MSFEATSGLTDPGAAARPVTTVVFDVGNGLLRWDPRFLYRKLFADEARMEWFLRHVCTPEWNIALDRGGTFADAIAERIAHHPEWEASIRAFDERWGEMVPHEIEGSVALLRELRRNRVPTYAITNFSREKYAYAVERFAFLAELDGVVVSAHEGLLKPELAIYRTLVERYGLDPARCLFIDDSQANVAGAEAAGMQGVLFEDATRLERHLRELGLL